MHSEAIVHQGIVKRITGDFIEVEIQTGSACAHCSATDQCVSADKKTRIINIDNFNDSNLSLGDTVTVKAANSNGLSAVLYAYFIPFLLIVITLFIMNAIVESEAIAGLISLSILIPYYSIIWLLKDRLKKRFTFKIIT
jgi:sigma-E factor negative regulatory protein RseC